MGETLAFWDKALKGIADHGRAGAVDPVGSIAVDVGSLSDHGRMIFDQLEAAQKSGLPLAVTVQAMRQELRAARIHTEKRSSVVRIMILKTAMMCGMALLLRSFLPWRSVDLSVVQHLVKLWGGQDAHALLLGLLWLGLGATGWGLLVPRSWIWGGNISSLGARWFAAHLSGIEQPGDPWEDEVQRIKQNAWLQGIPSMGETRQSLEVWAQEENHRVAARLRQLEELFPLWEMVVLGLSMVLFLIIPMLTTFAVMGEDSAW